ncbi:hypothetical protein N7495_007199 [Penicillium taxi]|uniref:uncharacterized protein n=1 Tax=Penicillium taxi TaxID=168475 RepID=UPI002545043D|nr:uncharacterized protein N7495_007199 [Penicillium taxi]KAJ5895508.1 hypothetical protein N7495_007199 [Penicillium taxi]
MEWGNGIGIESSQISAAKRIVGTANSDYLLLKSSGYSSHCQPPNMVAEYLTIRNDTGNPITLKRIERCNSIRGLRLPFQYGERSPERPIRSSLAAFTVNPNQRQTTKKSLTVKESRVSHPVAQCGKTRVEGADQDVYRYRYNS